MKSLLSNLALVVVVTVACLGTAELALRQVDPPPKKSAERDRSLVDNATGLMIGDDRTGWLPRAGARKTVNVGDQRVDIRINSTGQRGGDLGGRSRQAWRILFLGDSFTMATQVHEEQSFVARVGARLRSVSTPVEVVNGGVNGYGTYQELAYYRYFGRLVKPDVVVLCMFLGNDFRDNMVVTRQARLLNSVLIPEPHRLWHEEEPFLRDEEERLITDPLSGAAIARPASATTLELARRFRLAQLVTSRMGRLLGKLRGDLALIDVDSRYYFYEIGLYQQQTDGFFGMAARLTKESLTQLHRLVQEDGAQLVVTLIPSQDQVDPQRWARTLTELGIDTGDLEELDMLFPNRLVLDYCKAQGIRCLDLTTAFAAAPEVSNLYLTALGDRHISAAGHALAAAEIADFLARNSATAHRTGLAYLRESREYFSRGDLPAAANAARRGLATDPGIGALHTQLGRVNFALGDQRAAMANLRRAVEIDPENRASWESLSISHQAKVDSVFAAPVTRRRHWWSEHESAGTIFASEGNWDDAETEFLRAARFLPEEPVSHFNLGMLYERTPGRLSDAIVAYRRSLQVTPKFAPARRRLAALGAN